MQLNFTFQDIKQLVINYLNDLKYRDFKQIAKDYGAKGSPEKWMDNLTDLEIINLYANMENWDFNFLKRSYQKQISLGRIKDMDFKQWFVNYINED